MNKIYVSLLYFSVDAKYERNQNIWTVTQKNTACPSHKKIQHAPPVCFHFMRCIHKEQNMMLPPGTFGKEKSSPTAFGVFQVSYGRAFTTFLAPNHFSLVGDWLLSNIELILLLSRWLTSSKIPWSKRRRNCVRGGSRTGVTLLCNSLTFKPWASGDCFWVSRILQSHRNLLMSSMAITRHSYNCWTLHYKCRLEATADNSRQTCRLDICMLSSG